MQKTTPPDLSPQPAQPEQTPAMPEPSAGGNYLRDPVTGVITPNPAHTSATE